MSFSNNLSLVVVKSKRLDSTSFIKLKNSDGRPETLTFETPLLAMSSNIFNRGTKTEFVFRLDPSGYTSEHYEKVEKFVSDFEAVETTFKEKVTSFLPELKDYSFSSRIKLNRFKVLVSRRTTKAGGNYLVILESARCLDTNGNELSQKVLTEFCRRAKLKIEFREGWVDDASKKFGMTIYAKEIVVGGDVPESYSMKSVLNKEIMRNMELYKKIDDLEKKIKNINGERANARRKNPKAKELRFFKDRETKCPICLKEFQDNQRIVSLHDNLDHVVCMTCSKECTVECPICRTSLVE